MNEYILYDFQPLRAGKLIPQDQFLSKLAYSIAVLKYAERDEKNSTFESVHNEVLGFIRRYAVSADYISQRQLIAVPSYFVGEDSSCRSSLSDLYKNIKEGIKETTLNKKMAHFDEQVTDVFTSLYSNELEEPDDLIHATCTGYLSPSPAQKLIEKRDWLNTTVTHSYHMGCYGAFPPVRMAVGFLAASKSLAPLKKRVDIVHTEMCSDHFYLDRYDAGHIVNMTLFSDGFIRYKVKAVESCFGEGKGLKLLAMKDHVIKGSLEKMTWSPGAKQFEMFLSREVPVYLKNIIEPFANDLCERAGLNLDKAKDNMIFAIHPGGPKILNHIQDKLNLDDRQLQYSRAVLFEHGNMSSATIPHIWKAIVGDESLENGQKILTMAFGPGLTATGFVLELVK